MSYGYRDGPGGGYGGGQGGQGGYGGGGQSGGFGGGQSGGFGGGPGGGYGAQGGGGGYNPGGFNTNYAAGPPPGADPQLWQWFSSVDADRSGAITAEELQQCLINGDWSPFDLDTVKLLMSIFDTDRSGTIGFNEFSGLWKYIKDWQGVFRHFDRDQSGSIDGGELENALQQFGYNLSPDLMRLLFAKYDYPTGVDVTASIPGRRRGPPPGITFDRFVRCCVVIKTLTESFRKLDTQNSGYIQLNYDQFMHTLLSAP